LQGLHGTSSLKAPKQTYLGSRFHDCAASVHHAAAQGKINTEN